MAESLDHYIAKLTTRINNIDQVGPALALSVKSVQALMSERIFDNGVASDGSAIGSYNSSKPVYVSDSNSPKNGTHFGKPNAKGDQRKGKTTYYDSYLQFRQVQGRATKVNLNLFGRLASSFNNAPVATDKFSVAIKVDGLSYNKARGNEAKFGKRIFSMTKEENEAYLRVLRFEINKILYVQ